MLRSISTKLGKVNALIHLSGGVGGYNSSGLLLRRPLPLHPHKLLAQARPLSLSASRLNHGSNEEVDQSLLRLDSEIRRTGRVARQEIDEILQDIQEMKRATSSQSLMIIRCCGELVPSEKAENRTKLVQQVWKTMEALNVPMDISHYNALLRVYLENEFKFSPTEFLQELSNKGLEPNRVTYQRLIASFCQKGDIEGASTILQHMKEKQLPINEHVFNALINGHARADDMESAEGILSVMKQTGLEPTDDTFVTLMCGYARKGDLENINRILQDCEQKEVHLIDKDFLNIIYTLAEAGHEALVDQIFPLLRKQSGYNQEATNVILRLINIGKPEVAYKILKTMPRHLRQDVVLPSGFFFIDQIAKSLPTEEIIKYCQRMKDEEINSYGLSKACDVALQFKDFSKASELLQALNETGFPIRQHYFWPYFASSTQEKDIFDGFKCMKRLDIQPNNETLRDYIIPALFKHSNETSAEKTLERLSSFTGIPLTSLVPAAMQHLLAQKNLQQAIRFATKYRLRFENIGLRKAIVDMYFRDGNAKDFVKIVGTAGLDGADNAREAVGHMILDILDRSNKKTLAVLPILKELLNQGLGLSNGGAEIILNTLGHELTEEVNNLIAQLTSSGLSPTPGFYDSMRPPLGAGAGQPQFVNYDEKSVAELEALLEDAKKSKQPTRGLKKNLLFHYCRSKNVEKADAIRQEFVAEGFVFPTGLLALLLDMYSQCDRLSEAQATFNSLKATLDGPIDDTKILHYAGLLVAHDQFDECMNVLQSTPRDSNRSPSGVVQQSAAWKILNVAAEKGSVENVKALFNLLKERNLMHINNVTLGPLVKAYITRDDLEGALAEFERCVKEHHATPWKQELMCRFIKSEDTDRLQKIIDLSSSLHGEVNTMYDLVFALIACGKLRQAKKILETPGLRARNDKIELTCQKYLEEGKIGDLENLIQVTKDLSNIDRCSMYFYLLQAYCKINDADKALSVWTTLQEENIQPSPELLIYLADFLRKNDKAVPFIVPEESSKVLSQSTSSGRESGYEKPLLRQFRRALEENKIDTALQMKQKMEGSSEKIGFSDFSSLIDKMTRAERLGEATRLTEEMFDNGTYPHPKTLRLLIGRLSSAGSIDVLKRFEPKLTPDLKRQVMFNTRLCVAFINAGRGREYFDTHFKQGIENYEADAADQKPFPLAGGTYFLTRHEELLTEFEELAAKAEKKGILTLYNSLWNFHLTKKNFDKARELWNGKLKNSPRVLFRSVIVEARVKEDEQLLKELASQIHNAENVEPMGQGLVHGSVVEILCGKGMVDEGLKYLEDQLKADFKIEDFPIGTLLNIKKLVENGNKEFPHEIPQRTRTRRTEYEETE